MAQRYTIREIARLAGLPAATLRKWEERYGLVDPVRLANGYREYSPRDLAILRWVKAKVEGGALVSTAASEAQARLAAGWDPVISPVDQVSAAPPAQLVGVGNWHARLLRPLLQRDPAAVQAALDSIFAAFTLDTALVEVVQPVLYEIGQLWESGAISEYQEHYATVLLRDRIAGLRTMVSRTDGPLFLLACLPGELHEVGALVVSLLAGARGYRVVHLGAAPSPEGVKRAVAELRPAVLGFSTADPARLAACVEWLQQVADLAPPGCVKVIGGRDMTGVGAQLGGFTVLPGEARAALAEIDRLCDMGGRRVWQHFG